MRISTAFTISMLAFSLCPLRAAAQDFAPDDGQLVVPVHRHIQIIQIAGQSPPAIPKSEDGVRANWSPSGRYILFMTGGTPTSVRIHDTKTGETRILGGNLTFPAAWREDSGRIAMFHVPPAGKPELIEYSVGEKGIAQRTNIANLPAQSAPMVWLPATDNVAYLGTDGNIYTVEEGEIHKITTSNDVIGLALAQNGKSLIWARRGPNLKYILTSFYLYDLSSRSVKRVDFPGQVAGINAAPKRPPLSVDGVAFSPTGSWVALTVTENSQDPKPPLPPKQPGSGRPQKQPKSPLPVIAAPKLKADPGEKVVYIVKMDGTQSDVVSRCPGNSVAFWGRGDDIAVLETGLPGTIVYLRAAEVAHGHVVFDSDR